MARTLASRRQKMSAGRFVGRFAEQQLFRATLRQLAALRDRHDEQLTDDELSYAQIFLIAAEGGMGKTTLLRRFESIVKENNEGSGAQAIYLDLERHTPIVDSDKLMRVLHDTLCGAGFECKMQLYRDTIAKRAAAQKKAADAEEKYKSLVSFGGKPEQLSSDIHASAGESAEVREFIRKKLDPDEWKLYDDPDATTQALMDGLNSIAVPERPLVLLLDTYELADRLDSWLRKRALPQSNPRLVWAIAGREGQPFIRRYEDAFGASLIGRILLDTFARPDVVAYLQQCGITAPDDALIDHLQALSRGIPLALEGWFNLYQKNVELPPPDPAALTTRREIVRAMTDRFLRYCEDDKGLSAAERRRREAMRNHILTLMLLRRTDVSALAAAWQCGAAPAEATLNELADQFSFVFAQEIEREPHALVKEFLREHLRSQPSLPTALQNAVTRLVAHFEARLRQRERDIWGTTIQPSLALSSTQRNDLEQQREAHERTLQQLQIQIAKHTEADAPVRLLNQRADAERAIAELNAQLACALSDRNTPDGPRRPLWHDETWRELLLDLVNALCWVDRSGKRAMRLLVPMLVEALEFSIETAAILRAVLEDLAELHHQDSPYVATILAAAYAGTPNRKLDDAERLAILDGVVLAADYWGLTNLQRSRLYLVRARLLLRSRGDSKPEDRVLAWAAVDDVARLLPSDGGELATRLAQIYKDIGQAYLWPNRQRGVARSEEAAQVLEISARLAPDNQNTWYALGSCYWRLRRLPEALTALEKAISLDPKFAHPYNSVGNVYRDLKRYDEAMAAFQQAIALDPSMAFAHNNLGSLYRDLNEHERALASFQQAIAIDPDFSWPYANLARLYESRGQLDEALFTSQKALELDPTSVRSYLNLGNIYSGLNRVDDARNVYTRGLDKHPENHWLMIGLARIEGIAGNHDRTTVWIARARELLRPDQFYALACLESIAGNADAAIQALRTALEREDVSVEWARGDPDFVFICDDPRYRALVGLDGEEANEQCRDTNR